MLERQGETTKHRILIVEDEATNLQVIAECLQGDYRLSIAKSRKKAFELLESKPFDILLLDIRLPDGNGFDICHEIKSGISSYRDISIIFMTALDNPEDEAKGLKLGASDYICKPFNTEVLRARVALQAQLINKSKLLDKLANLDGLTEIPNRRAFDNQLQKEWNRAKRKSRPIALSLIDIDYFKQYNDHYGHPMGDACLKKLAWSLTQSFKRAGDFAARYGGEEFVIIMAETTLADAKLVLNRALNNFVTLGISHKKSKVSDKVTFSAGLVSKIASDDMDLSVLIESADTLLYQAKENGRNQVCCSQL